MLCPIAERYFISQPSTMPRVITFITQLQLGLTPLTLPLPFNSLNFTCVGQMQ